jgi:hypothetical protein
MNRTAASACSLVLFALAGCGSRAPRFDVAPKLMAPVGIDDHVALVDTGRSEVRLIDVSKSSPPASSTVVPIVKNATDVQVRNGHTDQLLVLCAGQPDVAGVVPERPGLVLLGTDGKSTQYRYDSAFDHLVQSEDGRYAFLFFDPTTGVGTTLKNPNEVAVIDLDSKTAAPELKTLRSLGSSPRAVAFSDKPASIGGSNRDLAVVLLDRYFAVMDLSHVDRSEATVELTKPGATTLSAAQVLFSTDEATPKIYVRAQGTDDVFVVSLEPRSSTGADTGTENPNDFALSFNQFGMGAGAQPGDLALFRDGDKTRLLVTGPGNSTAIVVDADTGDTTTVTLPMSASKIQLFTGPKPSDATPAQRALLYSPGGQSVVFLDLEGFGSMTNRAGNAELLTLSSSYAKLDVLDDRTVMLLNQANGLSLLKLDERVLSPITGPNLVDAVPDLSVGKLWLAPAGDYLGYLDLADFHPNEVRLEDPIDHLVVVPSKNAAHHKVVVTHPSSLGELTVLDAADPANLGSAYMVRDFLFQGVLQGAAR